MTHVQVYTKRISLLVFSLVTVVLAMMAYATTAYAAPLFEEPVNYLVDVVEETGQGAEVFDTAVADFNNDGFMDIAGTYISQNEGPTNEGVAILINNREGIFTITDYVNYTGDPRVIVTADFDGDEDADLVTVNNSDDLTVMLNDGMGNFTITSRPQTGLVPERLAIADFDNDGDIDLAVTVIDATNSGLPQGDPGVQIFSNDGDGNFALYTLLRTSATPSDLAVADFDGDNDVDLVVGNSNAAGSYHILINIGDNTFTTSETFLPNVNSGDEASTNSVVSDDLDGDGDMDVAFTIDNADGMRFLTLLNDGTGTFIPGQTLGNLEIQDALTTSDFDNDGDVDIIIKTLKLLINDGQGLFTLSAESITEPYYVYGTSIYPADLDNNGKDDLVVCSGTQDGIWVVLQTAGENPTPTEQATALIGDVIALDVPNNIENSYLANLFKVEGFIESGQITPAINQLNAFIGKVNQDFSQNKLTQQERDDLVGAAQQLINELSNL